MFSYSTHDDIQLVNLLKGGDTLAFTELYLRYKEDIYRYGITIVKLPHLAEDLVHDVFVKLWDGRESINIHTLFKNYLLRICHNRAIDVNKKIASDRVLTNQLVHYISSSGEESAHDQEELQRYDDLVREALDTLLSIFKTSSFVNAIENLSSFKSLGTVLQAISLIKAISSATIIIVTFSYRIIKIVLATNKILICQ